jgi:Prokaryotic dksA/traR C4-type zinc finger
MTPLQKLSKPRDAAPGLPSYEFRMLLQGQRKQALAGFHDEIPAPGDAGGIRLREIDRALKRIGDGSYGACTGCGGEIGRARLKSVPIATRCLACDDHGQV